MIVMFSQCAAPIDDFKMMNPVGLDPRMRENIYKGVLFPLPDVVIWFALKEAVCNIVARTHFSFVLARAAVFHALGIDWAQSECPGWQHCEYRTADVRELPPTHHGGRNFPGSKPRAREGVKVPNVFDIKASFYEEDKNAQQRLAKTPATPVDEAPRVNTSVREEIGFVVADDVEVQVASGKEDTGNCHNRQPSLSRKASCRSCC